ncbi:hypothetical protein ACFL04_03805 [Patescibacteria group bacterium]
MFKIFHPSRYHYFAKHPTKQMEELYVSVAIRQFAIAAMGLFVPIYLFTLGYSLWQIMMFYGLVYLIYILIIPFGGNYIGKYGYEKSIVMASIFQALHYFSLFSIVYWPTAFWLAIIFWAIQKMLYWPAFHEDFGSFSNQKDQGREVGVFAAINQIVLILAPLIAGVIIKFFGFPILFGVAILLILLSNVPILQTKEKIQLVNITYGDSVRYSTDKKRRSTLLAYVGFGEELLSETVWPIFIFIVVKDFLGLGGLVAGATLITALVILYVGRLYDHGKKIQVVSGGTLMYFISWLARLITKSTGGVFLMDSLQKIFKNILFVPIVADMYKHAGHRKHLILHGIFFEQGLSIGKIFAATLVIVLALFFDGFAAAFVIGGAMSLLYLFVIRDMR